MACRFIGPLTTQKFSVPKIPCKKCDHIFRDIFKFHVGFKFWQVLHSTKVVASYGDSDSSHISQSGLHEEDPNSRWLYTSRHPLNTCNRLTPRSCMQQLSLICHCTVHGRTLACEPKTVLPTLSLSCVRIAQDIVECCSFLHHVRRVNWHPTVNGYWALFVQLPIYCSLKWFIVTQCGSVSRSMYWRRFSPDVSSTFGSGAKFCPYFITDNDLLNRPIMP